MKKFLAAVLALLLTALLAVSATAATDATIDGSTGNEWYKQVPATLYDGKNNKETLLYFRFMWRVENNHLYVYAYIAEHFEANTTNKPGLILWIGNDQIKMNFVDFLNRDDVSKSTNAKYNLIYECVNEMAVQRRMEGRVTPTVPIQSFKVAAISNSGWQTPTYTIDLPDGVFTETIKPSNEGNGSLGSQTTSKAPASGMDEEHPLTTKPGSNQVDGSDKFDSSESGRATNGYGEPAEGTSGEFDGTNTSGTKKEAGSDAERREVRNVAIWIILGIVGVILLFIGGISLWLGIQRREWTKSEK